MARRDYICCSRCGCKVIYDGDDVIRDRFEDYWPGRRPSVFCPDCADHFLGVPSRVPAFLIKERIMSNVEGFLPLMVYYTDDGKRTCRLDQNRQCKYLGFRKFGQIPVCMLGEQQDLEYIDERGYIKPICTENIGEARDER